MSPKKGYSIISSHLSGKNDLDRSYFDRCSSPINRCVIMFILCMILHFTKNNTINCSVVMIQLLYIHRCLILIKCCIYLKQ